MKKFNKNTIDYEYKNQNEQIIEVMDLIKILEKQMEGISRIHFHSLEQ